MVFIYYGTFMGHTAVKEELTFMGHTAVKEELGNTSARSFEEVPICTVARCIELVVSTREIAMHVADFPKAWEISQFWGQTSVPLVLCIERGGFYHSRESLPPVIAINVMAKAR